MQPFNNPEEIKLFGRMIDNFSRLSKSLAYSLDALGFTADEILPLIGEGHYNTLDDKNSGFIRYAKHIARPLSGLFGAFVFIHTPEMSFTMRLPAYLGQNGFRFQAVSRGETVSWPLDEVKFDFSTRSQKIRGRILLRESLISENIVLEAGTPLTAFDNPKKWVPVQYGDYKFSIVDSKGIPVNEVTATNILWGSLGATGMKIHGQNSAKASTLGIDGTDDDFAAEDTLVKCLKVLHERHQTDLMCHFNSFVQGAAARLQQQPDMLEALVASKMICSGILEVERFLTATDGFGNRLFFTNLRVNIGGIKDIENVASETALMLGLELPEKLTNPALITLLEKFRKKMEFSDDSLNDLRQRANEKLCGYTIPNLMTSMLIMQANEPFSPVWLKAQTGNRILKNLEKHQNYLQKSNLAKILNVLGSVHSSIVEDVQENISQRLMMKGRTKAISKLKKMADAFERVARRTRFDDDRTIHQQASVALSHIILQLEKSPQGFKCSPRLISDIEKAYVISTARDKTPKLPIQLPQIVSQFLFLIKQVDYDFGKILELYGKCPEFDNLVSGIRTLSVPQQKHKALMMAPAA